MTLTLCAIGQVVRDERRLRMSQALQSHAAKTGQFGCC